MQIKASEFINKDVVSELTGYVGTVKREKWERSDHFASINKFGLVSSYRKY